jgi:hypothetical protein
VEIRAAALQYPWCYNTCGYCSPGEGCKRAARVGGAQGTPAAGLRPWPAREKGFPSNLFLDYISSL